MFRKNKLSEPIFKGFVVARREGDDQTLGIKGYEK